MIVAQRSHILVQSLVRVDAVTSEGYLDGIIALLAHCVLIGCVVQIHDAKIF